MSEFKVNTATTSGGAVPKSYVDAQTSTASTGITITGTAIASNLSTGKAGGQSAVGGTAASENLTLSSTSNATKGKTILGSASCYDEVNDRLGLGQTTPLSKIDCTTNALGTTQTRTSGPVLSNNTAAAVGAQQISPSLRFLGQGWKTDATAGSQNVEAQAYLVPVQSTANPSSQLLIDFATNAGSFATGFTFTSAGALTCVAGLTCTSIVYGGVISTTTASNGNFYVGGTVGGSRQTTAQYKLATVSGTIRTGFYGSTSSTLTAGDYYASVHAAMAPITTAATGTHPFIANLAVNVLGTVTSGGATVTNSTSFYIDGASSGGTATWASYINAGNSYSGGKQVFDSTITAGGTTGNQTINKPSGTVNVAAAGTTVTVTNSFCTTSSIVLCVIRTNDSTATLKNVVPSSGSFVITLTAAATAEVSIGFVVHN